MTHGNTSYYDYGPPDVCPHALILPIFDERSWPIWFRVTAYLLTMLYFFLGVAIITEVFMSAIHVITSKKRKIYLSKTERGKKNGSYNSVGGVVAGLREDEPEVVEVHLWNETVANLTLMALGTSAPEILLSIVETVGHNFEAGNLGPGTIVGSAAFNLLIITSVCMVALNVNEVRKIARFKVFVVTALFSFLAYIWLLIILKVITPDVVDLWEATVTFIFFPILTFFAYSADKGWCGIDVLRQNRNKRQLELGPLKGEESEKMTVEKNFFKEGKLDRDNLARFVKEVKKFPGLTDEDAAVLAASKLINAQPHSAMWYRIGTIRNLSGGRRMEPALDARLRQVYETMNDQKSPLSELASPVDPESNAIIEFHAATVAVKENTGKFSITVWRHGNLERQARVRVKSIDGTARRGEDYIAINEILTFEEHQKEKQVIVEIVNDNKWEANEEFFLRLSLLDSGNNVKLGRISIMEVTILDDDNPGIISFEKRGLLVKESAGSVCIPLKRSRGADGDVTVQWKTIDKSAISGRDYKGGSGEIKFKHAEVHRILEIPIINDFDPEKDECFEIELFNPTGGARIGNINRVAITIANDDDFNSVMDRLMVLTNANIDAIKVHTNTWCQQIKQAMLVNGGDVKNATNCDYVLHFFSFFWKVLFSLVPPPGIFGGWLCFFCSLICIGFMTAIIGDLATIFGCLIGLHDTITAITFVALGTSLPDTLASRMVTRGELYADGALIHITGSIAVNVLMGVGLPWFVAACYHELQGTVFNVPSGSLGFSVLMYSVAAVIAVVLIIVRRNLAVFGKAEIGGPTATRWFTVVVLVILWILYITFTWLQTYGVIEANF
uniref:Calx-beta domain-containing protein n=1 Tax=Clastoptera arizonana TaxID=38151 RepID=A0A1B6E8E5_9HEMI